MEERSESEIGEGCEKNGIGRNTLLSVRGGITIVDATPSSENGRLENTT